MYRAVCHLSVSTSYVVVEGIELYHVQFLKVFSFSIFILGILMMSPRAFIIVRAFRNIFYINYLFHAWTWLADQSRILHMHQKPSIFMRKNSILYLPMAFLIYLNSRRYDESLYRCLVVIWLLFK